MRALVIADIHGNATALRAILEHVQEFDSVLFLGDAVSPGPQPVETLELLEPLHGTFIRGNHDNVMLTPSSTEGWPDGFKSLVDWNREVSSSAGFEWLNSLNEPGVFTVDQLELVLAHGDENLNKRHLLPDSPNEAFASLIYGSNANTILFGHSHVQFIRHIGSQCFINPGSVGQNRCGHVVACFGLLTDGQFAHHHVKYDPTPWLHALDHLTCLKQHESFKMWFKSSFLSGFSIGEQEPWTTLASKGYL